MIFNYFYSNVLQNYLVFISANKYIKFFSGTREIYSWKSKGILEKKNTKNSSRSYKTFTPTLINCYALPDAQFNGEKHFCFLKSNKSISLYP